MNTALIFAGGTGIRMNTHSKPKQFLELHGKPVIIYTIEHFEAHPEIDNIVIVCLKGWIKELKHLLHRYEIEKVSQIIPGGDTGHESIYKGLKSLEDICKPEDIVLIHDGVRPLINGDLIAANIARVKENGNAITVSPVTESIVCIKDGSMIDAIPPREEMYKAKAPQSFRYDFIWQLYQKARGEGRVTIDSAHLCSIYGVEMYTVQSTQNNIKITSPQDYYIFRALYEAMESQQILGLL